MKINVRSLLTGVLLVLVLVAGVTFLKHRKGPPAEPVPVPAPVDPGAYAAFPKVHGPDSAPVNLVVYSDFECPSCRVVQETVAEIFRDYPGQIRLTYKHFPLTSHRWSLYAHQAAECMQIQGKFWPYHDKLYEKQREWGPSTALPMEMLAGYARELGANMDLFSACMEDAAVTRGVLAEKEEGVAQKIGATPTFFLGAERFVGPREMKEKGVNAVRRTLGLPEIPVPETPEPAAAPQPVASTFQSVAAIFPPAATPPAAAGVPQPGPAASQPVTATLQPATPVPPPVIGVSAVAEQKK